jgi:hypothetical protein
MQSDKESTQRKICVVYVDLVILSCVRVVRLTIMTGFSSDGWILLALRLQPLLMTLNHNTIAVPHTSSSSLHTH